MDQCWDPELEETKINVLLHINSNTNHIINSEEIFDDENHRMKSKIREQCEEVYKKYTELLLEN